MSLERPVEFWERARQAHDRLMKQLSANSEVTLIELGYNPKTKDVGLQIHLRRAFSHSALGIPEQIDGLPIYLMTEDYKPK